MSTMTLAPSAYGGPALGAATQPGSTPRPSRKQRAPWTGARGDVHRREPRSRTQSAPACNPQPAGSEDASSRRLVNNGKLERKTQDHQERQLKPGIKERRNGEDRWCYDAGSLRMEFRDTPPPETHSESRESARPPQTLADVAPASGVRLHVSRESGLAVP